MSNEVQEQKNLKILTQSETKGAKAQRSWKDYESEFSAITKKEPNVKGLFKVEVDWKAPNSGFYLFIEEKPAGFAIKGEIERRSDIAEQLDGEKGLSNRWLLRKTHDSN